MTPVSKTLVLSPHSINGRKSGISNPTLPNGARRSKPYSDEWYTPDSLVSALGKFDLDPCAGPLKNHAGVNIRPPQDGLAAKWFGRVWLNPPYSKLPDWLEKFVNHNNGILLVNTRAETQWYQYLLVHCWGVFFYKGRVYFELPNGKKSNVPMVGQTLFAFGPGNANALKTSGLPGVFFSGV